MACCCPRNVLAAILIFVLCLQLYYAVIGSLKSHMAHHQGIPASVVYKTIGISDDFSKSEFPMLDKRAISFHVNDKKVTGSDTRNVLPHKLNNRASNIPTPKILLTSNREKSKSNVTPQSNAINTSGKQNILTHKVFIYELPGKFNKDLVQCIARKKTAHCQETSDYGYGRQLYSDHGMTIRDTWQFALELIMLHSPHRTKNAAEASMFYVPYYGALASFCFPRLANHQYAINFTEYASELTTFLREQSQFQDRRPHLMTLGKIEREMLTVGYPTIPHSHRHHMIFIGIEQEINAEFRKFWIPDILPLIIAPYPSYGHLLRMPGTTQAYLKTLYHEPRNVFIFMAASTRHSSPFRIHLLDEFAKSATHASYSEYMATQYDRSTTDSIWLKTQECSDQHENETMTWMKHSVFCLQPSGDSPTRKSFYDAILAGCIPVIFRGKSHVIYPFERKLDYASFTVSINESEAERQHVGEILAAFKTIHQEKVKKMQHNILKVLPLLQYSYPPDVTSEIDALDMILQEALQRFNL